MAMPISTPAKVTPRNVATHTMKSNMLVCEAAQMQAELQASQKRFVYVDAEASQLTTALVSKLTFARKTAVL